jgi:hypothetical protein
MRGRANRRAASALTDGGASSEGATMRLLLRTLTLTFALAAMPAVAQTNGAAPTGPDEPATHLKPYLPPLNLGDAQRRQIRDALAGRQTQVEFQLKATKSLKTFTPSLGAKIPATLSAHALPPDLMQKLPQLADYKYVKIKDQILIVNPMTKKIVSMFPEQQG